jgi:DNA-directed RNA polymerase specialized sigma24 family protein
VVLQAQQDDERQQRRRWRTIKADDNSRKENELRQKHSTVPSAIFLDRELAPLESISEYLKDEKGLTYHEIATLLGRDDRTIWTCYNRAKKKRAETQRPVAFAEKSVEIPLDIFKNRTLAPLESITSHLKEIGALSFHEIAVLLNRDDRTIWTCYSRSRKKQEPN